MKNKSKIEYDYFIQKNLENNAAPEGMVKTPEGKLIAIPKRNKRGRKSRRKTSHPLRDIRIFRNMTLEELAETSGLSPSYLSRLESGSRRLNADTINKLSTALNCNPADILSSTEGFIKNPALDYNTYSTSSLNIGRNVTSRDFSNHNAEVFRNALANQHIPLYEVDPKVEKIDFNSPVCKIPAPAEISNIPGAFAFTAYDNSMEPRFYPGDRLLAHPGKPLSPKATALVITNDNKVILGEFIAWRSQSETQHTDNTIPSSSEEYVLELKRYTGVGKIFINQKSISSVSRIIGIVEG